MSEPYDVAIIGYGPAGATAAALLGQAGLRTLVVDRDRDVYEKPRAFALDHEILRVYQGLGLAEALLKVSEPFTPSEYFGVDGQLIKRLGSLPPPWPLGWPPNFVFTQPAMERALRARVAEFPSVEVALGTELAGFRDAGDAVQLDLRAPAGGTRKASARYLLGCDGASSTVRKTLGIAHEDLQFDEPWLVVDVMLNAAGLAKVPAMSAQYCNPSRPTTYLVGPGAHRRWEISLRPDEDRAAMENPEAVWRLLAPWIAPADGELWRYASYRFHALLAREWRRGRVFLAGDAAHQQPPFTGQGMCQGVRDVANLCWKLALVLKGEGSDALLDTYGAERAPHVKRLTTTIKEIGAVICERDPVRARERDARLLAEAGGEVKTVPRQHLIPPLKEGLLSARGHGANGTLFPQPRLVSGALMDDALPAGFRLVTRDAPLALTDTPVPVHVLSLRERPEAEGVATAWFHRHQCRYALVRPDHYVFGVAEDEAGARALVHELETLLTKEAVLQ